MRLLPVLCGTASIPLIYAVAKRLLSRTVGLWAAFLLAVSPLHVVQSQQIRYPVMLTMLGLAMIYFVIRSMESDRQRYAVAAGLIGTAMLYTNYFALGLIGALGIVALIHTLRSSQRKAAALSGPVLCFVLGIAFLGVFVAKFVWGFHMAVGLAVMFVAYAALLAVPWPGSWSRPLMGPVSYTHLRAHET